LKGPETLLRSQISNIFATKQKYIKEASDFDIGIKINSIAFDGDIWPGKKRILRSINLFLLRPYVDVKTMDLLCYEPQARNVFNDKTKTTKFQIYNSEISKNTILKILKFP